MNYEDFRQIINGSVQYKIAGTVLELMGYYTGKLVKIDLAKIDPEMLEEIMADEENEDEEDW